MSRWVIGGGGGRNTMCRDRFRAFLRQVRAEGGMVPRAPRSLPSLHPPLARSLMASPRHFPSRFSLPLL